MTFVNTFHESATTSEIPTPILIDHSPVLFSPSKGKDYLRDNSSLTKDQNYIIEIKKLIRSFCTTNESLYNRQLKWELIKYEVRKFTINYTEHSEKKRQQQTNLENQLKMFEKSLDEDDNLIKYNAIKNELDIIYDHIAEGIRIRRKSLDEHSKNQRNYF